MTMKYPHPPPPPPFCRSIIAGNLFRHYERILEFLSKRPDSKACSADRNTSCQLKDAARSDPRDRSQAQDEGVADSMGKSRSIRWRHLAIVSGRSFQGKGLLSSWEACKEGQRHEAQRILAAGSAQAPCLLLQQCHRSLTFLLSCTHHQALRQMTNT